MGQRRLQRLEGVRLARDEEVRELECLPERSARQEERLRTLRLEQEFERRAQEAVQAHGDEEEEDDEVRNSLRRIWRLSQQIRLQRERPKTN